MNVEQLKKNVGQIVRLRPIAHRYETDGRKLEQMDDEWSMLQVTDAGVVVMNQRTHHTRTLFRDQIHHYATDKAVGGSVRGFLMLNVQLYLVGLDIHVEPCIRPGEPVDTPPPIRELSMLELAARMNTAVEAEARNLAFQGSLVGIRQADSEFQSIASHLDDARTRIKFVLPTLDMQVRKHVATTAVLAFGFSALFTWRRGLIHLKDSVLRVGFWDGVPPFPGYMRVSLPGVIEDPSEMHVDEFTYGLGPAGGPGWNEIGGMRRHLTSAQLVESCMEMLMHFADSRAGRTG